MYAHAHPADHRTYRHTPSLVTAAALAALPPVVLFAAAHPTATAGLLVGLVAGRVANR